ncbi:MAG: hypothetical protein H7326_08960 [Bdellovibrionaceae bacterium]|nr:hypothetical protein [Pseudobdellovibrionaceae bacterium]
MFWCSIQSSTGTQQVYFKIQDSAVASGIGEVTLANLVNSVDKGSTEKTLKWVPFQQAQVQAQIAWSQVQGRKAIQGIKVQMGRSGTLTVATTASFNQFGSAPGYVVAAAMNFNYPTGTPAACSFYESRGTRPAMTGSN